MIKSDPTYAGYLQVVDLVKAQGRQHRSFVWIRNGPAPTGFVKKMQLASKILRRVMLTALASVVLSIMAFGLPFAYAIQGIALAALLTPWIGTHIVLRRKQSMSLELAFRMNAIARAAKSLPRSERRVVGRTLRALGGSLAAPHSLVPMQVTDRAEEILKSLEERVRPAVVETPPVAPEDCVSVTALDTADVPVARVRRGDRAVTFEYDSADFWTQITSCCFEAPGPNLDGGWGCTCGKPHLVPAPAGSGATASEDAVEQLREFLDLNPLDEAIIVNDLDRVADVWQKHWEDNPDPFQVYVDAAVHGYMGKAWGL